MNVHTEIISNKIKLSYTKETADWPGGFLGYLDQLTLRFIK